jgi:Na+/pantothenate symporter
MSQQNTTKSIGLTFLDGLTLVFIHAKLTKAIAWSWWLVLSPILVQVLFIGLLAAGTFAVLVAKKVTVPKEIPQKRPFPKMETTKQ